MHSLFTQIPRENTMEDNSLKGITMMVMEGCKRMSDIWYTNVSKFSGGKAEKWRVYNAMKQEITTVANLLATMSGNTPGNVDYLWTWEKRSNSRRNLSHFNKKVE